MAEYTTGERRAVVVRVQFMHVELVVCVLAAAAQRFGCIRPFIINEPSSIMRDGNAVLDHSEHATGA